MAAGFYDYRVFWEAVTHAGRSSCWVCDNLRESNDPRFQSGTAVAAERAKCKRVSSGAPAQPDAHHVVSKQRLRAAKLGGLLMDEQNGIPVRRYHHDQLEARMISFPERAWPQRVRAFAARHGFVWSDRTGYVAGRP
jgi:hypothetical protein